MNHFNWTYVDDLGKQYRVGLLHGSESGHLLVYCNSRIILIDFSVFTTSNYSFFIEEELMEISIKRKGNEMVYGLEINQKVDTPRNRLRKSTERRHWRQTIFLLGSIVAAASVFAFFFQMYFH